jgi:hypothetical protein
VLPTAICNSGWQSLDSGVFYPAPKGGPCGASSPRKQEPSGWRQLCAKQRTEKDPLKFQSMVDEINRLLLAHEKQSLNGDSHSEQVELKSTDERHSAPFRKQRDLRIARTSMSARYSLNFDLCPGSPNKKEVACGKLPGTKSYVARGHLE